MSDKCRAYSESKLGVGDADSRKAFYAGWGAAMQTKAKIRADFFAFVARIPDNPANLAESIRSIKLIKGAAMSALEKMENQQ